MKESYMHAELEADSKALAGIVLAAVTFVTCCGPLPDPRALLTGDLQPPIFLGAQSVDAKAVEIEFHEEVKTEIGSYEIVPSLTVEEVVCFDTTVKVRFSASMEPGSEYCLYGSVRDESGNSMKFITKLFGYNAAVPDLIITEFTTRGSGNHPDCVELYVRSGGNLAGVAVYEGTPVDWSDRIVFPSVIVESGDYIIVHFKPEGIDAEINEIERLDESGGRDAHDNARDFWIRGGDGLSGNNGVLTICASPRGPIVDAVLYSNRTSSSDDRYRGFGSTSVMAQADFLAEIGEWIGESATPTPEDAVNPEESTSTRSLCRSSAPADTNSRADWHIVPTRGASFGERNSDEIHVAD